MHPHVLTIPVDTGSISLLVSDFHPFSATGAQNDAGDFNGLDACNNKGILNLFTNNAKKSDKLLHISS